MKIYSTVSYNRQLIRMYNVYDELISRGHDLLVSICKASSHGQAIPPAWDTEIPKELPGWCMITSNAVNLGTYFQPDVLVVNDIGNHGWPRFLRHALRVPSVALQGGFIHHDPETIYVDRLCIYGEHELSWLEECGVDVSKCTIVGIPHVDAYHTIGTADLGEVIYFAQSGLPDPIRMEIGNVLGDLPYDVAVKEHPDLQNWGKEAQTELCQWLRRTEEVNTRELIRTCKCSITVSSGTGLESIMMGKPTVILNVDHWSEYAYGGSNLECAPDDLPLYIDEVLSGDRVVDKEWLHRRIYLQDGMASSRVADCIEGVVNG